MNLWAIAFVMASYIIHIDFCHFGTHQGAPFNFFLIIAVSLIFIYFYGHDVQYFI